jgi:hypothetical protein
VRGRGVQDQVRVTRTVPRSFGVVVMIGKLRMCSPAGERQLSTPRRHCTEFTERTQVFLSHLKEPEDPLADLDGSRRISTDLDGSRHFFPAGSVPGARIDGAADGSLS